MAKLGTHSHHVRGLPVVQVRNVADVGSYEPVCDGVNLSQAYQRRLAAHALMLNSPKSPSPDLLFRNSDSVTMIGNTISSLLYTHTLVTLN